MGQHKGGCSLVADGCRAARTQPRGWAEPGVDDTALGTCGDHTREGHHRVSHKRPCEKHCSAHYDASLPHRRRPPLAKALHTVDTAPSRDDTGGSLDQHDRRDAGGADKGMNKLAFFAHKKSADTPLFDRTGNAIPQTTRAGSLHSAHYDKHLRKSGFHNATFCHISGGTHAYQLHRFGPDTTDST